MNYRFNKERPKTPNVSVGDKLLPVDDSELVSYTVKAIQKPLKGTGTIQAACDYSRFSLPEEFVQEGDYWINAFGDKFRVVPK